MAHEIAEANKGLDDVVLIGLQTGGVPFAEAIAAALVEIESVDVPVGKLDVAFYRDEVWRGLNFTSLDSFYEGFWQGWFGPMDPNNLLCMARKWRAGDVTQGSGTDLATALGSITAKTTVVGLADG